MRMAKLNKPVFIKMERLMDFGNGILRMDI